MASRTTLLFILLIVASTLLVSHNSTAQSKKQSATSPPKAKSTQTRAFADYGKYDFTMTALNGDTVRLSGYGGKVVLLNIWAPWCGPCAKETPGFVSLYKKYRKSGFDILGVAVATNEKDVRNFVKRYDVPWTIGISDAVGQQYQASGIPDSYLFRADGSLVKRFLGYTQESVLEEHIKDALKSVASMSPQSR
jgi:thiol-disulfide isomerase/thioredoxin